MSESILLIAHTDSEGKLAKHALEVLQAAFQLAEATGANLSIGIFGNMDASLADQIGGSKANTTFSVNGPAFEQPRYASDAAAVAALTKQVDATIVLAPATSRINRVLPGVARRLGGIVDPFVTEIEASEEKISVTRWYYRQRLTGTLTREMRPWFISVSSGCFEPWQSSGSLDLTPLTVDVSENRTQVQGIETGSQGEQTILPDAETLFVAGAGWTKKQEDGQAHVDIAESLILEFLKKAQASLGSSKSMVDLATEGQDVLSFMTHLHQIGQTGSSPRHKKGLATCCHGEEPHSVGWRFVNERRAVNTDANCGWAQGKADVLYVADAYAVMQELNKLM